MWRKPNGARWHTTTPPIGAGGGGLGLGFVRILSMFGGVADEETGALAGAGADEDVSRDQI